MTAITYNNHEAALIIDGTYHYEFLNGTNIKDKVDSAEAIFCTAPRPNGNVIPMSERVKSALNFIDKATTYDEL